MNAQATQVKKRRMVNVQTRIALEWERKCAQYEQFLDLIVVRIMPWLFPLLVGTFLVGIALHLDGQL